MGNLLKEVPYSEITAFLEALDHAGMTREDLRRVRPKTETAKNVVAAVRYNGNLGNLPIPAAGGASASNSLPRLATIGVPTAEEIEAFFEGQIQRLLALGYPAAVRGEKTLSDAEFVARYMDPLRAKLSSVRGVTDQSHVMLVIAVAHAVIPLSVQMTMVKLDDQTGKSWLDDSRISYLKGVSVPHGVWLATDIENGGAMLNKSPNACMGAFSKSQRLGVVVEEGVGVATHYPDTLKDHYIDCPGSRYDGYYVPGLFMLDGRPALSYSYPDCSDLRWGSASCGERLGL